MLIIGIALIGLGAALIQASKTNTHTPQFGSQAVRYTGPLYNRHGRVIGE